MKRMAFCVVAVSLLLGNMPAARAATVVAQYDFENGTNLGLDSLAANHGTASAGVSQAAGLTYGGSGAFFDGTTGGIQIAPLAGYSGTPGLSLEAWVKLAPDTAPYDTIFSQNSPHTRLLVSPNYRPYCNFEYWAGGPGDYHLAGPTIARDKWTHMVLTAEASGANTIGRVYINGVESAATPITVANPLSGGSFTTHLGNDAGLYYLRGTLDGVRIYQGALTPAEVASLGAQWSADASGNWHSGSNWSGGVPNAPGAKANFYGAITAPRTVTVDAPATAGELTFNNTTSYTLAASGANAITLQGGSAGQINVVAGGHTVAAPLALTSGLQANVAGGAVLTLSGAVGGAGNLVKNGAGTAILAGANAYSGETRIEAGTLTLSPSPAATGLQGWYDASTGVTVNPANNVVTGWADRSGNGRNTTAVNSAPVLAYDASLGRNVIQLRGNDDFFTLPGSFQVQEVMTVFRAPGGTFSNYGSVWGSTSAGAGAGRTFIFENNNTTMHFNPYPPAVSRNGTALANPYNMAPINQYMVLDVQTANADNSRSYYIGRQDGYTCDLDIAEIFAFDHVLTAAERARTGLYLAAQYGIASTYGPVDTDAIPDSSPVTVSAGATFNVNGCNETIGSLAGSGNVTLGSGRLAVGGNNQSTTFSGPISGAGGKLAKQGAGVLTLTEANTYGGGTEVLGGTLSVDRIADSGPSAIGPGGTLTLAGGSLRFTGASGTTARSVVFGAGGGTVDIAAGGTLSLSAVSGGGGLTKSGAGTLAIQVSGDRVRIGAHAADIGPLTVTDGVLTLSNTYIVFGESGGGPAQYTQTGGTVNFTGSGGVYLSNGTGAATQMTISGGTFNETVASSNGFVIGQSPGGATLTVTGTGVMNLSGEMWIGRANPGTLNLQGGSITQSGQYFVVGNSAGGGTYNQTGGTYNYTGVNHSYIGNGSSGTGTMTVSGGTFTQNSGQMFVGQNGTSAGILTVGGGPGAALVKVPTLRFGNNSANAAGTVNLLANGVIEAGTVNRGSGPGTFNFDGGTLRAAAANTNFMSGLTAANVKAGGARIETGFNVTVAQNLQHDPALGAIADGGLTKLGGGVLTLTGNNSYTGQTTVVQGTLRLGGPLPGSAVGAWFDASNGVGIQGGNFAFWTDLSSNARTTSALAGSPALAENQVNGLPVVQFRRAGGDDYLSVGGSAFAAGEVFTVFRSPLAAFNNYGSVFGSTSFTAGSGRTFIFENNNTTMHFNPYPPAVVKNGTALASPYSMAAIDQYMVLDVQTANAGDTRSYYLGRQDGYSCDLDVAEVLAFTRVLTATERQAVGSYLGAKYGLATTYGAMNQGAIPDLSDVQIDAGGTLDVNGTAEIIGSLAGSGNVALGGGILITGANGRSTTFSGPIAGPGTIMKQGAGEMALTGNNTFTTLSVREGSVRGNVGNLPANIAVEGQVIFDQPVNATFSGTIAGSGSVTKTGPARMDITRPLATTGDLRVEGGTLAIPAQTMPTGGLQAWYDASTGLTANSSNNVTAWADRSANGRNLTATGRPILAGTDANGLPAVQVRRDSDEDYFAVPGSFQVGQVFGVFRSPYSTFGRYVSLFGSQDSGQRTFFFEQNQTYMHWNPWPLAVSKNGTALVGPSTGNFNLAPVNQYMIMGVNVANPTLNRAYFLGRGDSWSGDLDFAEVLAYDHVLTAAEQFALGSYLAAKYGIANTAYVSNYIPDGSSVVVSNAATLDLGGNNETIGSLAGTGGGTVNLGGGWLTTGGNGQDTLYQGHLAGPGRLTKTGAGAMLVQGTIGSASAGVPVGLDAGMMGLEGELFGKLTVAGGATFSAGNSPGHALIHAMNLDPVGYLQQGTMQVEIGGYIQGLEYDWIEVEGQATLGGTIRVTWDDFIGHGPFYVLTATGGITNASLAGITFDFSGAAYGQHEWRASIVEWGQGGEALRLDLVPEPATMGLLALAGAGLARYARRRRR